MLKVCFNFSALIFNIISVYSTCTHPLTQTKYNIDANLDASDNVISGNEP